MARDFRTTINKFLGLHQCEIGEGDLKIGESPRMKNLTVTSSYTLSRRDGYCRVCDTSGVGRGVFSGSLNGSETVVWVVDEKVYKLSGGEAVEIGQLDSSQGEVMIFPFGNALYFLDGIKIKKWNGESFSNLNYYVPVIAISCDYTGAGTPYEDANLLTGRKRQRFTPDGTHKTFQLAEKNLDSIYYVELSGEYYSSLKYTVNLEEGTITFETAPEDTTPNCLEVWYSKENENVGIIDRMRYAVAYGADNDTRIFLWGDANAPTVMRYSGVHDGVLDMAYFPELSFNSIGDGSPITSIIRHYDTLMVFTENEAFSCYGEKVSDLSGVERMSYPVKTVSSETGCTAMGFARLIDNKPVTLSKTGLYRWSSSTIRDERNAQEIGQRIKVGLGELGVHGVRSFDRASSRELFIWKGERIFVYNYALDLFYYYEGFDAIDFSEGDDGESWFIRRDGALCKMTDDKLDDGKSVDFEWESGYEDFFGLEPKNVHRLEFEVFPISKTSFGFLWVSERNAVKEESLGVEYKVSDFDAFDFGDTVFLTAVTPVRLHKRIKTKRTRGFKLILKNDGSGGDFNLLGVSVVGRISDVQ